MPSPTVIDMAMDHEGMLWLVTRMGVAVFDRGELTQFPLPKSMDVTKIHQIKIDAKGDLFFATSDSKGPIYHRQGSEWEIIPAPPNLRLDNTVTTVRLALSETDTGPILAYLCGDQLFFYQAGQWSSVHDGLARYGKIRRISGLHRGFLAATSKGLFQLDPHTVKPLLPVNLPASDRDLLSMVGTSQDLDHPGPIYTLSPDWISVFDRGTFQHLLPTPKHLTLGGDTSVLMFLDEAGDLILANGDFVDYLMRKNLFLRSWNIQTGLIGNGASCVLLDREHGLWIGGAHGLTRIQHRRFDNYTSSDGLPENEVSALLEWQPGRFLVGQNHSLSLFDRQGSRPLDLPVTIKSRIMELKKEPDGGALVAALGVGILRLDPKLRPSLLPTETPILLHSAERDREGVLWATGTTQLYRFSDGAFRQYHDSALPPIRYRRVQLLSSGRLVLSTYNQGIWLREDGWRNAQARNEAGNNVFTAIEDHLGRILVGSKQGLMVLQGEGLTRFAEASVTRPVFALHEDSRQRLWIGTDNGIFRYAGGRSRHYTTSNGLIGMEINRGAMLEASDGDMWFGTTGGLSHYREPLDFEPYPPKVVLLDAATADQHWPADQPRAVEADNDSLTIRYRAYSMEDKDSVWVRYMLAPYDNDWRPTERASQQLAQYHRLPPGQYTFHIKAGGSAGNWSEPVSSATITVAKPLFQRAWFIACTIALALLLGFSFFDYLASKRFSRFLQLQVSERTSELTSKNQLLLEQIQDKVAAEAKIQALNEDLEARVRARTAELEVVQRDLVENAHYAGMAEIATSMLHNVGNVLNSISTAGFLMQQTLEHSKLLSLQRANDLLRPHVDHFEQQLREDPKARDLLRFYLTLGDRLTAEHQLLGDQVHSLLERIDTIKDIVAQQHNYTSGVYQTETLSLELLLETSLKIMEASLGSRDIAVVRHFELVPAVNVQKTKMIHTMVNLLKNAAEAIMTVQADQREIQLRSWACNGSVFISITDSGCGIPVANLGKIFNHGFTTKATGHGFGLHSCANALKEMGGTIWAQNRKDGTGAVFTIRLPLPGQPALALEQGEAQAAAALEN